MVFKDSTGVLYDIPVNVLTISRLKRSHGIDLTEVIGPRGSEVMERITGDVCTFLDVLASLLGLDEKQLEQMARNLDESGLESAVTALVESILNFFPPEKRKPLLRAFQRSGEIVKTARAKSLAAMAEAVESDSFREAIESQLTSGG